MLRWLIPALIGVLLFGITVYYDVVLIHVVKLSNAGDRSSRTLPLYSSIMFVIVGTAIALFQLFTGTFSQVTFPLVCGWLISGALYSWGLLFYYPLLEKENPIRVIFYLQGIPVITMLVATFVFHESLAWWNIAGLAVIILALAIYMIREHISFALANQKSGFVILFMNMVFATSALIYSYSYPANMFATSICFESFGWGIAGLLIYFFARGVGKDFRTTIKTLIKKQTDERLVDVFMSMWKDRSRKNFEFCIKKMVVNYGIVRIFLFVISELIFISSKILIFGAFAIGPVVPVSIISNQVLLVGLLIGPIFYKLLPNIYLENDREKYDFAKIINITMMIGGLILISI